eukprot:815638-Prymnesium_polylepis.1
MLRHGEAVLASPRVSAAAAELWPTGGRALGALLLMVLQPSARHELRRGLLRLREQDVAERAPWMAPELKLLREWLLVPQLGLRGSLIAHDDLKVEHNVPCASRLLDATTRTPLAAPSIAVSVSLLTSVSGAAVRLHLHVRSPVLVRVPECFSGYSDGAGLFDANVTAVAAGGKTCDVAYVDRVELLLGRQIHEAEFNLWTQ